MDQNSETKYKDRVSKDIWKKPDKKIGIEEYEQQIHIDNSDTKNPPIVGVGENLNLGCGFKHMKGFINVDTFDNCGPDVLWDLNKYPWPWGDQSIDYIFASHLFEHLDDWWGGIKECARVLKLRGTLHIRVPDESDSGALTYRDHKHVLSVFSFYGLQDDFQAMIQWKRNHNAWAERERGTVPLKIVAYAKVPYPQYNWMAKWCPWLLEFCCKHMRNFIHEQRIELEKMGPDAIEKYLETKR